MERSLAFLSCLLALGLLLASKPSLEAPSEPATALDLLSCVSEAKQLVDDAFKFSRERAKASSNQSNVSPYEFLKRLKEPVAGARSAIRAASYLEVTLDLVKQKVQVPWQTVSNITDLLSTEQKQVLFRATGCDYVNRPVSCAGNSPYRTITGECNNRQNPHFGASNHGYARWLPAEYEDGISLPRGLIEGQLYNGHPLPLVRKVSNEVITTPNEKFLRDAERSHAFMQWGQLVDHDLDLAPMTETSAHNKEAHCDTSCNYAPPCFPIKIPPGDPRITKPGVCMPFIRSAPVCNPAMSTREQLNAITSFLDASTVYGSERPLAQRLRNQSSPLGLMALNENFTDGGLGLLPFEKNPSSHCLLTNRTANIPCFEAGDKRVTVTLGLTALHTLFVREHNRLATELKALNPHWDGEKLYQEARKVVGAIIEGITFGDYLPLLLGTEFSKQVPPYRGYNDSVDPTVSNAFSLAFRFGHGSIPPVVPRLDEHYKPLGLHGNVLLHLTFCASWRVVMEGGIDPLIRGLLADHAKLMQQDQMMVVELQEHLFEQLEEIGLDLSSLNLQRGRDHGLPAYNAWRRFCGLSQPADEAELATVLQNTALAKKLIELYGTPSNIDLWIGAMAEPFVPQGRVGPLLACLIGLQFRKVRDGDRFWWENPGVFTPQQRHALSSDSLSRVICDNTHITEVPRDSFRVNRYPQDFVNCREIQRLDLSAWKEEQ